MVFESVLTDFLNKFLKPYVKKLDTSQLKLGIWGGNVSLGKLELKEDLFDQLDLPLIIKRSYIGDIKMKIPWKSLAKDPIIVNISDVYVIVAPYFDRPYDEERHIMKVKNDKEKQISKIEEAAKKMKQIEKGKKKGSKKEKDPEKPDTFAEKLTAHLIKNLKVNISNIHVRYEDNASDPTTTVSIGASLHSLQLISTDGDWKPCVVKETATLIYKLIELNSVSVYWNTYSQTLADLPGDTEWMLTMKEQIARPKNEPPAANTYVLQPLSASFKMKLNLKPTANQTIPQLFGNFECDDIDISLREDQFKSMMFILDSFSRFKLNDKYSKYKPAKSLKESKKEWWKYAYNAVLKEDVKRRLHMWSWKRMKKHRENCRTYTEKYHEKITSKINSSSLLKQIDVLENELDVFNIMLCRKLAVKRKKMKSKALPIESQVEVKSKEQIPIATNVKTTTGTTPGKSTSKTTDTTATIPVKTAAKTTGKTTGKTTTKTTDKTGTATGTATTKTADAATNVVRKKKEDKSSKGFFSRFKKKLKEPDKQVVTVDDPLSIHATPTNQDIADTEFEDVELPPPGVDLEEKNLEKERFFEAIGYSEEDEYTEFPPEYVAHHITAGIASIKLHLLDKKQRLMTVAISDLSTEVLNRPTNGAISVSAGVGGLTAVGIHEPDNIMITSSDTLTSNESKKPLVDVHVEVNPLDSDKDLVVSTTVRPLKIVYHEETVDGLIGAFRVKKNIHLMELTSAASSSLQELQSRTSAGLQAALQNRKQVDIDISIQSPYIILPENGFYKQSHHLILIDFGSLAIKGSTKDYKQIMAAGTNLKTSQGTLSQCYDSFFVKLSDLQVLVVKPEDDWMKAKMKGNSSLHIMEKTALEVELRKSIISDDALLPSLQIIGEFPGFKVKLNDDKLRTVLTIVSSLQLPPPALKNTTTYYNELPPPPTVSSYESQNTDVPLNMVHTISVDTIFSFDDEDDSRSFSPTSSIGTLNSEGDEDTSHFVFTDVKMHFKIQKIEVLLNQVGSDGEDINLLAVSVNKMEADVSDRNWDLRGIVSINSISILDYITKTTDGKPSYLLKTETLTDGNFINAKFVKITPVGMDFASKYTGLNNSATVQLSMVYININQGTAIGLVRFLVALKPALEKKKTSDEPDGPTELTTLSVKRDRALSKLPTVDEPPPPTAAQAKQFDLKANFDGIHLTLNSPKYSIMSAIMKGFAIDLNLEAEQTCVVASIEDVSVLNSAPGADMKKIVNKMNTDEKMVILEVNYYPYATKGANFHNLDNVDVLVDAKIQRINAFLDSLFIENILKFVTHLKNEAMKIVSASMVATTTETALATASALKDTESPSVRVKLNITLLAPFIQVPFKSRKSFGMFCISLGNFTVSNRFIHGYDAYDTRGTSISLATGHTILDRIEVDCKDICLYIEFSRILKGVTSSMSAHPLPMAKSEILNDLHFFIIVTRKLSRGHSHLFPDVKIQLELKNEMKLTISDSDIQSLFAIVTTLSKMADSLPKADSSFKKNQPVLRRSTTVSKPRGLTQLKPSPAVRLEKFDPDQAIKVQVNANLNRVVLELYKEDKQILVGSVTEISSVVKLTHKKLMIGTKIEGFGIIDPQSSNYNTILTLTEKSSTKALSLTVEVPMDDSVKKRTDPLASIDLSVGRVQLYLPSYFINSLLDFALSIDINPGVVKKATKAAQEGATVAKDLVQDVYVKLNVAVRAPVILLPCNFMASSAIMVDLGNILLSNEANEVETDIFLDCFSLVLKNFKLSRVLLSDDVETITSERILIQPYSLEISLKRNLCTWNTNYPSIDIDFKMGEFKVSLGEKDILFIVKFIINMAEEFVPILSKKGKKQIRLASAVVDGLTEGDTPTNDPVPVVQTKEDPYKKISLSVSLSRFAVELFTREPQLNIDCGRTQAIDDKYKLACFQIVSASVSLAVYSNDDVQLQMAILDLAIIDEQPEQQGKRTGNRILQQFTKNPLQAYTGEVTEPLLKVEYNLSDSKHNVVVNAKDILLLSDIGFLQSVADHFKNIFSDIKPPQFTDESVVESPESSISSTASDEDRQEKKPFQLPWLKVDAHIKNIRVAIIESQDGSEPQAITLKTSIFTLVRFDPDNNTKQASLNVSNLDITTSSFFDLDTPTSAILVPTSIFLTVSGPLDNLMALDINGTISTLSLKLSPSIVRLILHAVKTLATSAKKSRPPPAPTDLWIKQRINSSKHWFLLPIPVHSQVQEQNELEGSLQQTFTLTIEGVELILETEATERVSALPVLSFNVTAVLQAFDWTGKLAVTADLRAEASYFNTRLSVWEPLLEPLVTSDDTLKPWSIQAEINRSTLEDPSTPEFLISLSSTNPLQFTLTKSSIKIMKEIAESCLKEYGKKVEGSVNVSSLTGAPFTIVNELGLDLPVSVKPGTNLKLLKDKEMCEILPDELVNIYYKKIRGHTSYASIVTQANKDDCFVDLTVGQDYQVLPNVPIDSPGSYYYQLKAKNESLSPNVGIVVEIKVTGAKKTITIRSPLQVYNHTQADIELLVTLPLQKTVPQGTINSGDLYNIPFGLAFTAELSLRPKNFGMEPSVPKLVWQKLKQTAQDENIDIQCHLPGGDESLYHIKVIAEEDTYTNDKGVPDGIFAHHVYHLYPPIIMQNLLPSKMTVEPEDGSLHPFSLKPGDIQEVHLLNLSQPLSLFINLPNEELCGQLRLPKPLPKELSFTIGKDRDTVVLSVLHENLGYHRLSIYCPFWMVNKSDLQLVYKDEKSGRIYKHPPGKGIVLLSCHDHKSPKIRLNCYSPMGSRTEWSKSFSLQAIGTSGRVSTKLSETLSYEFGVAVQLSKFTLSKLVIVTPYYMIANQTNMDISACDDKSTTTLHVPSNTLKPFWPNSESNYLSLSINNCKATPFNFKSTDNVILALDKEPTVVCAEVQETGSANVVTISSYYEGCVPVLIMNLFTDFTVMFKQDKEPSNESTSYLEPGESVYYTWADPSAKRMLKWGLKSIKLSPKSINISKDGKDSFGITPVRKDDMGSSLSKSVSSSSSFRSNLSIENIGDKEKSSLTGSKPIAKGHWMSFLNGLQRVLVFTHDESIIDRLQSVDQVTRNKLELSLSMKSIGISLINDIKRKEVAYIGVTQSGVIWQVSRKKGHWKTLNTSVIAILEEAHQKDQLDIKHKDLLVNLKTMEMFVPLKGSLRRTHYDGVELRAAISENDFSINAKVGYVQIDNQLPISVYPQMLYPLPPPPTVASTIEPKPFFEASVVIGKTEQKNVNHFKYVHVLVQRLVVNVDLGFMLALLDLVRVTNKNELLEAQYVLNDIEDTEKSLQDIALPAASDESVKRNFFDFLHIAPIKVTLSFSVGHNKFNEERHIEERFLQLFLHSLGVILTSVQEAQMNFSLFHLEYIAVTWSKLIDLFIKHYRTQGLVAVHSLVLGLDVLGNPVNVVRGVVSGTIDLFYEPIKGSVLGPDEFAEGLGIGLKSFFGGTVGGLTGAGARITGTVGDVFAKLSFDSDYMDRRQLEKVKGPGIGSTVGGFFKNVAEGVSGVVVQPIKGVKEEGALGFFKGTGIGLVGLLVRPAGGLFDLTSGTLEFVTKKTKVGNVDIVQIRPPRYIGRDGIIVPYYPKKAIGKALLQDTDEGKYVSRNNKKDDFYIDHCEISKKPHRFLIATDRRCLVIEPTPLVDGWKSIINVEYKIFYGQPYRDGINIILPVVHNKQKNDRKIAMRTESMAYQGCLVVNNGLVAHCDTFVSQF